MMSRDAPSVESTASAREKAASALESSPAVAAATPRLKAAKTRSAEPLDARSMASNSTQASPGREEFRCSTAC